MHICIVRSTLYDKAIFASQVLNRENHGGLPMYGSMVVRMLVLYCVSLFYTLINKDLSYSHTCTYLLPFYGAGTEVLLNCNQQHWQREERYN